MDSEQLSLKIHESINKNYFTPDYYYTEQQK